MDPFSITVGTIGLISGVNVAVKLTRKLAKLRNVPSDILELASGVRLQGARDTQTIGRLTRVLTSVDRRFQSRSRQNRHYIRDPSR